MKNLTMIAGLLISLFTCQVALASPTIDVTVDETVDVITVVAKPDSTDFAVFSLSHAQQALDSAMGHVVDSIEVTNDVSNRLEVAVTTGS